jgi:hypothetical protein
VARTMRGISPMTAGTSSEQHRHAHCESGQSIFVSAQLAGIEPQFVTVGRE